MPPAEDARSPGTAEYQRVSEISMVRVYRVFGITGDDCKRVIENELKSVDGVRLVEVDVARRTVRVDGNASEVVVRAAISAAGYGIADIVTS